MNPFNRTLKFVCVAAASALLAAVAWYASQPSDVAGFGDIGQPFFPDFDDVTSATSLSVVDYDTDQKEVASFSVKQNDDGLWVIPSHHNYPAEAEDRLAKTATSLMGIRKTAVQSRSKDDWKRYGVVAPDAKGAATAEERGTRLTLSDGSDNALVDLIVGNEVEGRSGNYFVRVPDNNTTYVSEMNVDLSAKFSDWIEPDLLKIEAADIVEVVLDNYSVNEERGTVEKKEVLQFAKAGLETSGDWELADLKADTEEFDSSPVAAIATNLDALKIVGVRPKPDGLEGNMRVNPAVKQILQMQMQSQGYFIGGDKDGNERLYSNEGELLAGINNGVQYTLYFGEIARGTGKDIEIGLSEEQQKAAKEEDSDNESEATEDGPRRYLLVKVDFNESLLGEKPIPPLEPIKPEILKEDKTDGKKEAKTESETKAKTEETAADSKGESAEESSKEDEAASSDDACDPVDEEPEPAADESQAAEAEAEAEPTKSGADTTLDESKPAADRKPDASTEDKAETSKAAEPTKAKPADAVTPPAKPEPPKKDPKQLAQEEYAAALVQYQSEKSTYEMDLSAFEVKVKDGQKKAKELTTRFGSWYYVISSDSFEKFRVQRKDVVSAKAEPESETEKTPEADATSEAAETPQAGEK